MRRSFDERHGGASMKVLEFDSVTRQFGAVKAVDGLSLSMERGEILGFLGANGAGKTTAIKMITGLVRPTSGAVRVFGADPANAQVRAKIGYMPEIAYYYPYLNARELLEFYGGLCGIARREVRRRADGLLDRVGLGEAAKRPLATYSKGMLQRAGIAQALLGEPELLVLDEPFTGLDPLARIRFRALMKELRDGGTSVFFSSHELGETELLCDRVAIMKAGRCRYLGAVKDLAGDGSGNLERLFLKTLGEEDAR